MQITLIAALTGVLLGCVLAGAMCWYLVLSRPYRKESNRIATRLGQFLAVISVGGGLFLLQMRDTQLDIKRHSSPYYAAVWAYLFGWICIMFFALRADLRWQKSVGLDRKV
jgi:drug/metabolite transporter (DMT)-like permease